MRPVRTSPSAPRARRALLVVATLIAAVLATGATAGTANAAWKPPSGVSLVTKTPSTLTLKWTPVKSAPGYRVKYSTSSKFTSPKYVEVTNPTITANSLKASQTYYFQVRVTDKKNHGISKYGSTFKTATAAKPATPPASKALRVGSYNIRCETCYVAGNVEEGTWADRRSALISTIKGEDLDVLGIQEASQGWLKDASGKKYDLSQFQDVAERLGSGWKLTNSKRNNCVKDTTPSKCVYKDQGASLGTRLLYDSDRVKLLDSGSKMLPETDATLAPSGRHYVAWAQLQQISTGTKFMMANTHLSPYAQNYQLRADQAKVALATVKAENPKKLPMITVGDWNSGKFDAPSNAPYDVWVKGGFVDPLGSAYGTSKTAPRATVEKRVNTWLNSFNGFLRQANGHPTWVNGTYIDYIMTTPMRVSEWKTVANLDSTGKFIGRIPSDHNMIRATVWLPVS